MSVEISYLIASLALFVVMVACQALFSIKEHGLVPLAGSRDGISDQKILTQRAKRANQNMIESLILFAPLVLIAAHLGISNSMTILGAKLFFFGRLLYAPIYWFGVPWLRTVVWGAALLGVLLILFQVLPL